MQHKKKPEIADYSLEVDSPEHNIVIENLLATKGGISGKKDNIYNRIGFKKVICNDAYPQS